MDFFREQDIARRNTRFLVVLFIVAVCVLIALTNIVLAGAIFWQTNSQNNGQNSSLAYWLSNIDWRLFFTVSAAVAGVIGVVAFVNWLRFAQGGRAVAEALGARPAQPATTERLERRAQNIVQELSLAANMPVPPLYILDDERGINAFAAGITPANAVVAITHGAMTQLTRDELQGVIGHEFSHILNGDMRLSIRLAAMLRGITFIGDIGTVLMHSAALSRPRYGSKKDSRAGLLVVGLGLYLVGLLGGIMAGVIKSAISKQKEFLADASSVQFTRNPDGIGNALKVIGGYTPGTLVHSARAEELSHLFFGQVKHRLWSLFATHPPLDKRIRRVDPSWDGQFIKRRTDHSADVQAGLSDEIGNTQARRVLAAAGIESALTAIEYSNSPPASAHSNIPVDDNTATMQTQPKLAAAVLQAATDPLGAMSLILGLLWHRGDGYEQQIAALQEADIRGLEHLVAQYGDELSSLAPALRLPLIELCLPALKQMSVGQYQTFKKLLISFIKADAHIDLFEWSLYQLLRHYLDPEFARIKHSKPRFSSLKRVSGSLAIALGTLAQQGDEDTNTAFERGAQVLGITIAFPSPTQLTVTRFSQSVTQLADCYPLLKVTILKAMATVAGHDGYISPREMTLIKAIAAVIDCPLPNKALEEAIGNL